MLRLMVRWTEVYKTVLLITGSYDKLIIQKLTGRGRFQINREREVSCHIIFFNKKGQGLNKFTRE